MLRRVHCSTVIFVLACSLLGAGQDRSTEPANAASPLQFSAANVVPEAPVPNAGATPRLAAPLAPNAESGWAGTVYPFYFWVSGFQGRLATGGVEVNPDVTFWHIANEFNGGYMGAVDVRKHRVGLITDVIYASFTDRKTTPRNVLFSGFEADAKLFIINPDVYYRVVDSPRGLLDLTAGFRYWHLSSEARLLPGLLPLARAKGGDSWADPTIGMRIRANLDKDKKWYVPVKGDVGGFGAGSDLTWSIMGGLGRNVKDGKLSLELLYRYLDVDRRNGNKVFDVAMNGPMLGLGFNFGAHK